MYRDTDFDCRLFTAKQNGLITDDDIYELLYTNTLFVSYFYDPRGGGSSACCECTGYFRDRHTDYQFDDVSDTESLHYDIVCPRAMSLVFDWKNGMLYSLVRSLIKKRVLDYFIQLAKDSEKGKWFDVVSLDRLHENVSEGNYPSAFDLLKTEDGIEEPVYFNYKSEETNIVGTYLEDFQQDLLQKLPSQT